MDSIAAQRKRALFARRRLTTAERRAASVMACRRLARLPALRRARHIGLYRPLASEIDPRPLIEQLGMRSCDYYFPRVEASTLRFVRYSPSTRWQRSTLGVDEPVGWPHAISRLDVLIMPLAAFDEQANRIGLGGGYYDRTLAPVRDRAYRCPARIGLAFACQQLDTITARPWDVPLAAVVTEAGIHRPARPRPG